MPKNTGPPAGFQALSQELSEEYLCLFRISNGKCPMRGNDMNVRRGYDKPMWYSIAAVLILPTIAWVFQAGAFADQLKTQKEAGKELEKRVGKQEDLNAIIVREQGVTKNELRHMNKSIDNLGGQIAEVQESQKQVLRILLEQSARMHPPGE